MIESSTSSRAMTVFSLILLIAIIAVFAWMWFGADKPSAESFYTTEKLQPVSVAGLESRAKALLDGLQNNSGIPVSEPTTKEGRADPFASL